ncbi:MAG: sigma-70 family RNA polymerase sigma factor [Nibricoccus sp.]
MIEDTELLRRYVETGSQDAFAELVERRIGLVYSVALRRTGAEHHAREVAQSVFTDLARKAAALSRHTSLVGWLYRSAYFAAATHMRAEKNRTARETEAHTMSNLLGADSPEADWEKIRPVLDEVLSELDERDREAVLLRFFDNRPFGEIGSQLKLGENAARMRVDRALDKLHGLFARRGIRSTSAALGLLLAQQATAASAPAGLATTTAAVASAHMATVSAFTSAVQFMATTKTAIALAGVVLIGTTGAILTSNGANRSLDADFANAQREHDARAAKLANLRTRVEQAEAPAVKTEADLEAARAAQADELKQRQEDMKARLAQGTAWLSRHPEVKDLVIREKKTRHATVYNRLFKALALTPAQIDRFLDLQCVGLGGVLTTPDGQPLMYELDPGGDVKAAKEELRALLGEDGYKKYRDYERSMAGLQTVTQLGGTLSGTTEPLTKLQGERLLEILAANKTVKNWTGRLEYDWETILRDARPVLSEQQLSYLEDLRVQDEFSQARTRSRNPNL